MKTIYTMTVVLLILSCGKSATAADQYFGYEYKNISVTAQGNADFARTLAHNLYRLDLSMAAVLQKISPADSLPTAVYAVPSDLFVAFSGLAREMGSVGQTTPYRTTLLINTSQTGDVRYFSAYYALSSGVLGTTYSFRYPPWFTSGMCEVFAASVVDHKGVTIGGLNAGRLRSLVQDTWIPFQVLLTVRPNDPQMSSPSFAQMYAAESWYLVHKIIIDQFYHTNFYDYFKRIDRGEDESTAFSAAFSSTYAEMDKALQKTIKGDKFIQVKVSIADEDDGTSPVLLSPSEAKGRLALYAAEHGVQPDAALTLAAGALKIEPGLANAQAAKMRAELRVNDRETALHDADTLCSNATAHAMVTTCAFVYSSSARGQPTTAGDLMSKARQYYQRAVALEPDDLQSWFALSQLAVNSHDVALAGELLPTLVARQAARPHAGALAWSVATLYSVTGDNVSALKYALLWQASAISANDRARASAYVERVKSANDRKQAVSAVQDSVSN